METLCLVSSTFRDITLEVACKAFGVEREENHRNYPRWAYCDGRCLYKCDFSSHPALHPPSYPPNYGLCIHANYRSTKDLNNSQ